MKSIRGIPTIIMIAGLALMGCQVDERASTDPAVPDGTYLFVSLICDSDSSAIVPDSFGVAAASYSFKDLNVSEGFTTIVAGTDVTDTYMDADCTFSVVQKIGQNLSSTFQLTKEKTHTFDPSSCTLTANHSSNTQVGTGSFTDSSDTALAGPFTVTVSGSTYTLKSIAADYSTLGCTTSDKVVYTYTKQ